MERRLVSTWWMLRIAIGAAPLLLGLDKFTNLLASWSDYLSPVVLQSVPLDPEVFLRIVGIVEIVVGIAILTRWTRWGAYVAAAWFAIVAASVVSTGSHLDVAIRDLLLAVSAFTLARLTEVRQAELAPSDARRWRTSPTEILTLKL